MSKARKTAGRITFVGAGPGDPGLLTVRAVEALRAAQVVVLDPEVTGDAGQGVRAVAATSMVRPAVASRRMWRRCWSPRQGGAHVGPAGWSATR